VYQTRRGGRRGTARPRSGRETQKSSKGVEEGEERSGIFARAEGKGERPASKTIVQCKRLSEKKKPSSRGENSDEEKGKTSVLLREIAGGRKREGAGKAGGGAMRRLGGKGDL